MNVGAYWYCKFLTIKASIEGSSISFCIRGKQFEYENSNLFAKWKSLTSQIAEIFVQLWKKMDIL